MTPPSDTADGCQNNGDPILRNTDSTSAPPTSPPGSIPSPQPTAPQLDDSLARESPTSSINEPQRAQTSPEVARGLHQLGVKMPQDVTDKVVAAYTGMNPMVRFAAETCNAGGRVPAQGVTDGANNSSCQANPGSFASK